MSGATPKGSEVVGEHIHPIRYNKHFCIQQYNIIVRDDREPQKSIRPEGLAVTSSNWELRWECYEGRESGRDDIACSVGMTV